MDTSRSGRTVKTIVGQKPPRFEADRVCVAPGCATRLSRYNAASGCSQHLGWADGAARPRTRTQPSPPEQ